MTPNELLLWLSARKEGSWPQFRGAVETLDLFDSDDVADEGVSLPLHQRIRFNLERLGHLEFGASKCENGWRVVPPTLALCEDEGRATGILCGARTDKLLERIERAAGSVLWERSSCTECPDVLRMQAPEAQALIDIAGSEGILCQRDAPTALLCNVPPVDSISGFSRSQLPKVGSDWDVQEFVIDKKVMRWRRITLQEANASGAEGLFRFTRFQMPQYFLREDRETIRLPGAIGKYYVLFRRRRRVLRYDRNECRLTLPAIFRPPLLTERALVLCSGFPPSFSVERGRRILTYRNISEEVTGMVAEALRQDFS